MSEGGGGAIGGGAADVGLALLLGGGVADAIAGVEATLAIVQGATAALLSGLSRVQAAGAAAASVPPTPREMQMTWALPEAPMISTFPDLAAEGFVIPPAVKPAGPEQVATFAPVSASDDGAMAPAPLPLARQVQESSLAGAPIAGAVSDAPPASAPAARSASIQLALFAPPMPATPGSVSGGETSAVDTSQPAEPWSTSAPEPVRREWVLSAAPIAAREGSGAAPRDSAPSGTPSGQSGPTGGDVFLDGVRVGTWLADHLAHEAGRPQTGGTGFDPRLTPAWPGTLQGN